MENGGWGDILYNMIDQFQTNGKWVDSADGSRQPSIIYMHTYHPAQVKKLVIQGLGHKPDNKISISDYSVTHKMSICSTQLVNFLPTKELFS